jgi:hypothetical protein
MSPLWVTDIPATNMSTIAVSCANLFLSDVALMCPLEMNLSHVITELSFGPFFPEMTQPLDNSFEIAHERTLITCLIYDMC